MPNFSPNHLNYTPNTENNQNEILSDKQRLARLQNEIGSKVLTLVGFESRIKTSLILLSKKLENKMKSFQVKTMNVETSPIFLVSIIWSKNMVMH